MSRLDEVLNKSLGLLSISTIPIMHILHYLTFIGFMIIRSELASLDISQNIQYLKNDTNTTTENMTQQLEDCKKSFVSFAQPVVLSSILIPFSALAGLAILGSYLFISWLCSYMKPKKAGAKQKQTDLIKHLLIVLPVLFFFSLPAVSPVYAFLHWYIYDKMSGCINLIQTGTSLYSTMSDVNFLLNVFLFENVLCLISFLVVHLFFTINLSLF